MITPIHISRTVLRSYFAIFNRSFDVNENYSLPDGPKIIAMNHTPGFDPLYLPFILKDTPHFLLQDGMFKIPFIGWMLKGAGQIPVYRGTDRAKEAKEQACDILRAGGTIAIFPEGKDVEYRSRIPAKTGVLRMALETGAPIIPVGLYAPHQKLTHLNFEWEGTPRSGAWQFSGKSYLRIGTPFIPNTQTDIHLQTEELMDRIYSLVAVAEKEAQLATQPTFSPVHQW